MKTHLLLFGVLCTPALACASRDLPTARVDAAASRHVSAAMQPSKSAPDLPTSSTARAAPVPKSGDKDRGARPARPEYLFL